MPDEKKDNKTAHSSSVYDVQILKTIPYYKRFHQETIRLVETVNPKPQAWLDTGCGTGTLAVEACKIFPETQFLLADPSLEMLNLAKRKLTGKANIRFIEGCGSEDIKWPVDEKPDVITAIQSHHYFQKEERKAAVKNCFYLLKNGGIFITFENIRPFTDKGVEIGKKYWAGFEIKSGKTPEEAEKHVARFGKEFFPLTVEEHLELYRQTGFSTVEILWYSGMQAGFYCIK